MILSALFLLAIPSLLSATSSTAIPLEHLSAARRPLISYPYDMRRDLTPSRLAIAMWDFSWLKGHYTGGPFENWAKAIRELKDRGFNTVRIDAFPILMSKYLRDGGQWTVPADPKPAWGFSLVDATHDLPKEFAMFIQECERQQVYVILSTWGEARDSVTTKAAYWKCWEDTLDFLIGKGLAKQILYVDLDQEFPYFSPFAKQLDNLAKAPSSTVAAQTDAMEQAGHGSSSVSRFDWNPKQMNFVKEHLGSSLRHFQQKYPGLRFTFSFTSYWKEIRALELPLDVLELHIWIHEPRFDERTGFGSVSKERGQSDLKNYMRRLEATFTSSRPMLLKSIDNRMQFAQSWSEEAAAPLVTTESWGPWWHMDQADLKWDWLYDWCEDCMQLAQRHNFWGVTPWNYSHPYWANWQNVRWYQRVNERFSRSSFFHSSDSVEKR